MKLTSAESLRLGAPEHQPRSFGTCSRKMALLSRTPAWTGTCIKPFKDNPTSATPNLDCHPHLPKSPETEECPSNHMSHGQNYKAYYSSPLTRISHHPYVKLLSKAFAMAHIGPYSEFEERSKQSRAFGRSGHSAGYWQPLSIQKNLPQKW